MSGSFMCSKFQKESQLRLLYKSICFDFFRVVFFSRRFHKFFHYLKKHKIFAVKVKDQRFRKLFLSLGNFTFSLNHHGESLWRLNRGFLQLFNKRLLKASGYVKTLRVEN